MAAIGFIANNAQAAIGNLADQSILPVTYAGAPSGSTGAGDCARGTLLIDTVNGILYINTGTKTTPVWTKVGAQV
jgi:hypothetical protein